MHGSFQFATLKSVSGARPRSFSARVARLTLSSTDEGATTPCAEEPAEELLQPTSVRSTRRVIVGASTHYLAQQSDPSQGVYRFVYDVQINNARASAVAIVGHSWSTTTRGQDGAPVVVAGPGVGGMMEGKVQMLPAGEAFRVQGVLTASGPEANAHGFYAVRLNPASASAAPSAVKARAEAAVEEAIEVAIGDLALSVDDRPVPQLRAGSTPEDADDAEDEMEQV